MKQFETLENDFWTRWFASGSTAGEKHDVRVTKIPVRGKSLELTLAIDACWIYLMEEAFGYWENTIRKKNPQDVSQADYSIVRRKMVDAFIELELTRSVHEEAQREPTAEHVRLARAWLIRCLKLFTFETPLYIHGEETPWNAQAQEFLRDFFKSSVNE